MTDLPHCSTHTTYTLGCDLCRGLALASERELDQTPDPDGVPDAEAAHLAALREALQDWLAPASRLAALSALRRANAMLLVINELRPEGSDWRSGKSIADVLRELELAREMLRDPELHK